MADTNLVAVSQGLGQSNSSSISTKRESGKNRVIVEWLAANRVVFSPYATNKTNLPENKILSTRLTVEFAAIYIG